MGVTGIYPGGVIWAVRWSEEGSEPRIQQFDRDEQEARSFHSYLERKYVERNREDVPELLAVRIHWQVQHP